MRREKSARDTEIRRGGLCILEPEIQGWAGLKTSIEEWVVDERMQPFNLALKKDTQILTSSNTSASQRSRCLIAQSSFA